MENKTSRYFKYAIGEIILVVIGILIAIQINSIYSDRAKTIENKLIIKRMVNELENNVMRLKYIDTSGQQFSRAYFLPSYQMSEINLDSCHKILLKGVEQSDIAFLIEHSSYNFSLLSTFRSVYDEMLNTGKIYSLKSDSLTTAIDNYYKLLERQSNYVNMQMKEVQRSYEECKHGWMYFKQEYQTDKENAIINNTWLFDKNALEYKNLSNFIFKAKTVTIRTRDRIHRCINESEDLSEALKKYIND